MFGFLLWWAIRVATPVAARSPEMTDLLMRSSRDVLPVCVGVIGGPGLIGSTLIRQIQAQVWALERCRSHGLRFCAFLAWRAWRHGGMEAWSCGFVRAGCSR